jgi:hypothetical protein
MDPRWGPDRDLDLISPDELEDRDFLEATQAALMRGYSKLTGEEEDERQARIDAAIEHVCAGCGCSESRSCPGGCVWATDRLCSRCV